MIRFTNVKTMKKAYSTLQKVLYDSGCPGWMRTDPTPGNIKRCEFILIWMDQKMLNIGMFGMDDKFPTEALEDGVEKVQLI